MTEGQKTGVIIIRLAALWLIARGVLGGIGFAAMRSGAVGFSFSSGMAGMAMGSLLLVVLAGIGLWFLAPPLVRFVSYDLA